MLFFKENLPSPKKNVSKIRLVVKGDMFSK